MVNKLKSLQNHKGFQKYLRNTSWLIGEKILRMFVGVLVGVWVARYLGPEKFGLLSYAASFVGLFIAVATFGLDNIVIRELVKDESKRDDLLGTSFRIKLLGAFLVFIVLTIAINFTSHDELTNSLIFIIASITIFQGFNVIDFYFQSKVLGKYTVFAKTTSLIVGSIIKIVLVLLAAPLIAFAWVILFESAILAIGYIYVYNRNNLSLKNWKFGKATTTSLLKESWPLLLSGLAVSIYMRIDQVMIKALLGNEFVGQYAAAVQLSEAWYFIPMVISASLFPAIINSKTKDASLYHERLKKLYRLMIWIALAISLPTTFLSDWIIYVLYGNEYSAAGRVLSIHVWAGVFVFLGVASGKWLIAENLQQLAFYRTLCGLVINVCLNLLLIPEYGINGAAFATLCSQIFAAYIFDLFHPATRISFYLKSQALFPHRIVHAE